MAANVSRLTCAITQCINIRAAGVWGKPAASSICARIRINARNNNVGRRLDEVALHAFYICIIYQIKRCSF